MSVLADITIEDLLGPEITTTDSLQEKLLQCKDLEKEKFMNLTQLNSHQVDRLLNSYSIKPSWIKQDEARTETVCIKFTAEERQRVVKASAKCGVLHSTFGREVLMREVERILSEKDRHV